MNISARKFITIVDNDFVIPVGHTIRFCKTRRNGEMRAYLVDKNKTTIPLARYVCGLSKTNGNLNSESKVVDHINHNTLDNRRENLRVCSFKENLWGKVTKKGKYRGISLTRYGWYHGEVKCGNKRHLVKNSPDIEVVREQLVELRKKLYGEFSFEEN